MENQRWAEEKDIFSALQTWPMNEDNLGFAGKAQEKEGTVPYKYATQTSQGQQTGQPAPMAHSKGLKLEGPARFSL